MTYETLKTRGDWSIEFCTCLSFCFGFLFTLPLAPNSAGINLGGEISQPSHWISCNAKPNLPIPLCGVNAGRNGSGVNGGVGAGVNAGVSATVESTPEGMAVESIAEKRDGRRTSFGDRL